MKTIFDQMYSIGIIPVVKIGDGRHAIPLGKALLAGGIAAVEVTFRTDAAAESIRQIAQELPELLVCAGTVLDVQTARRAVEAGAKAIISPGTNREVVEWCLAHDIPVIPGCATPTEVEDCIRLGLSLVKLFPAEVVGRIKMLKALSGPYPGVRFMPTGGISAQNLGEYLTLANVICCGGSWIAPEELIDAGRFDEIERLAKISSEAVLISRTAAKEH